MAGYPSSAGYPTQTGIMIPARWSLRLLRKLYAATVLAEIANTDYEGEIKEQGDTLHIRTTPTIYSRKYTKGQKLSFQIPQVEMVDLVVDQGYYFAFSSNDVTKHQADYNYVEDWQNDAVKNQKISIETDVYSNIYTTPDAYNKGATAGAISGGINLGTTGSWVNLTSANILDYISQCAQALNEQNVPDDGDRWMILPAWASQLLQMSDLKAAFFSGESRSPLYNGKLAKTLSGFTLYESNLLPVVTDTSTKVTNILFGHKMSLTFAAQITKTEGPMRQPGYFDDFYQGLTVYGYKVIKPQAIGNLYAAKG